MLCDGVKSQDVMERGYSYPNPPPFVKKYRLPGQKESLQFTGPSVRTGALYVKIISVKIMAGP